MCKTPILQAGTSPAGGSVHSIGNRPISVCALPFLIRIGALLTVVTDNADDTNAGPIVIGGAGVVDRNEFLNAVFLDKAVYQLVQFFNLLFNMKYC